MACSCCGFKCESPAFTGCRGRIDYSYGPVFSGVPTYQEIAASRQTYQVPFADELGVPFCGLVQVRFCGGGDDGIAINGVRKSLFGQPVPESAFLTLQPGDSFTVGTWNVGGPAVGRVTICFVDDGACCNGTTCTVKPQCQCDAAAGEVFKGVGTVCEEGRCDPCFRFCQPSNTTPPETIYFTISNYTATWPFLAIGSLNGTYALSRDLGSADCQSYGTSLYPTDCQDVGQPAYCFSPCTHKILMTVNQSSVQVIAFDRTDGFPGCVGFSMFRSGGFNSCTQAPVSGSYSSISSNVVRASFDYLVTASNPLP